MLVRLGPGAQAVECLDGLRPARVAAGPGFSWSGTRLELG
jgi:hypothetical protein